MGARSGGGGGGTTKSTPSKSQKAAAVQAKIATAEAGIRNNRYETAIVFSRSGKEIKRVGGQKSSVVVGDIPENSILTHNHPSNSSFSSADIKTSVKSNVSEIRAVGRTYTYSLKRPKGGWNLSPADAEWCYKEAGRRARKEVDAYYYRNPSKRAAAANLLLAHYQMKIFAQITGWKYTKQHIR